MTTQVTRVQRYPFLPSQGRRVFSQVRGRRQTRLTRDPTRYVHLDSDEFRCLNELFKRTAYRGLSAGVFADSLKGAYDVTADVSSTYRAVEDLASKPEIGGGINNPYFYSAMGLMTGGYHPVSFPGIILAYDRMRIAKEIGDEDGATLALIDTYGKAVSSLGGLSYLAVRPMSIASAAEGISASSAFGQATWFLGKIGGALFALSAGAAGAKGIYNLYEIGKFTSELEKRTSDADKMAFLRKSVDATYQEVYDELYQKYLDKGVDPEQIPQKIFDELIDTGLTKAAKEMHENLKALNKEGRKIKVLSEKECKSLIRKMRTNQMLGLPEDIQLWLDDAYVKQGFDVRLAMLQKRKDDKMGRILGADCIKMIRENEEPSKVLKKVNETIAEKRSISYWQIAVGVFGILSCVLAFIFSGGIAGIIVAVLAIIYNLVWLRVDYYSYAKALETAAPGKYDNAFLGLSVVGGAVCLVLGVLFTCLFAGVGLLAVLASPAFIIALAVFLIWAGTHIYAKWSISSKNPTLEYFLEQAKLEAKKAELETEEDKIKRKEKIISLFKKLPVNMQRDIRDKHLYEMFGKKGYYDAIDELLESAIAYHECIELHKLEDHAKEQNKKAHLLRVLQPVVARHLAEST